MPPPRGRGWGHCKRERGRLRLSPARARAHAPARDGPGALEDLPRRGGAARRGGPAPVRRRRVRALSQVRDSRQRLRAGALHGLRGRTAGRLLLQGPRLLPLLYQPPHARYRRAPGGGRDPAGAGAPVGVLAAALGALSARPRPATHHVYARHRSARDLRLAAPQGAPGRSGRAPRRRGDLRAALRRGAQPQRALPLRDPGRRVRPRGRRRALCRAGTAFRRRGDGGPPPRRRASGAAAAPEACVNGGRRETARCARRRAGRSDELPGDSAVRRRAREEARGLPRGFLLARGGAPARERPRGPRESVRLRRPTALLAGAALPAPRRPARLPPQAALGDGRTALLLQPGELLRRLATLVPPPRAHLLRYHGVFAPASRWRREVVPPPLAAVEHRDKAPLLPAGESTPATPPQNPCRTPWAELLLRVFREDVLACPCGRRRVVLAYLTEPRPGEGHPRPPRPALDRPPSRACPLPRRPRRDGLAGRRARAAAIAALTGTFISIA